MEEDHEDFKSHSSSFVNASPSSSPPLPSKIGGGDDDSWSEGATSVLIDAWGKRLLERKHFRLDLPKKRHFRPDDWKEVANTVSNRQLHTGTLEKTAIQCFDRMESLKRQYMEEKHKTGAAASNWLFFDKMDRLLRSSEGFLPEVKRMRIDRKSNLNRNSEAKVGGSSEGRRLRNSGPDSVSELTLADGQLVEVNIRVDEDLKLEMEKQRMEFEKQRMQLLLKDTQLENVKKMNKKPKARFSERGQGRRRKDFEDLVSELTRAVTGFVELYERVEKSKLEQVVEMERGRIEFEKGLELNTTQFLKDAVLEVAQMNRNRKIEPSNNQEKQKQGEPDDGTE